MDDRRRDELLAQYDDLTMSLLMDEAAENDGNLLWEDFTAHGTKTMPKELDDACQKLIRTSFMKEERKRRWIRAYKKSLRAAIITLCLLVTVYTTLMKVDALRIPITNFFIETHEKFSVIAFGNITPTSAPQSLLETMENAAPVGYYLTQKDFPSPDFGTIMYKTDADDHLVLDVYPSDMEARYDTEDAIIKEVTICGISAIAIEKVTPTKNYITIFWLDKEGNTVYKLYGSILSMKAMTHIAAPLIELTAK